MRAMTGKPANDGPAAAHTRRDPGEDGAPGDRGRLEERDQAQDPAAGAGDQAQADQLAEQIDADQPGLFEPPEEIALPLPIDARELAGIGAEGEGKRGPGRPPGSSNKRDLDAAKYLLAKGYRSPLEVLAAIYSADTLQLASKLTRMRQAMKREFETRGYDAHVIEQAMPQTFTDPMAVLQLQREAARDALPFWHAKKTPEDAPPPQVRPVMVIGQMNTQIINDSGAMSAGIQPDQRAAAKTLENQPVSDVPDVRRDKEPSHDDG